MFEKEFERLRLGLDERRTEHSATMEQLRNDIDTLDSHLEGRRARTRVEREDALLRMENELRKELENKWRQTLEQVKTDNATKLLEEETQAKISYQTVVDEVGTLLHDEYKGKLEELDVEQTTRQNNIAIFVAQIDAMAMAKAEAEEKLIHDRERLIVTRDSIDQERKDKGRRFDALRLEIRQKWRDQNVSLQDRVQFMLRVDEVAKYGDGALQLYEEKIEELETAGPILLCIKKREEMIVRMKSVLRYVSNPEQSIQDGTAQLLQRVGFTLPSPMTVQEAEMHQSGPGGQASRREKIRREAACHKLLEQ